MIPSVLATMATSVYTMFDTVMIGQYEGDKGLVALNIVLPLYSLCFGLGVLAGVGGAVHYAVEKSRGESARANAAFSASFACVITLCVLYAVVTNVVFTPLMRLLGADSDSMGLVSGYGRYVTAGGAVFILNIYLMTMVRNDGRPKLAMAATVTGGIINIVLDYLFVFTADMGMSGAALATVISYTVSGVIAASHFVCKKCGFRFTRFGARTLGEVLKGGVASLIYESAYGILILVFNLQILRQIGSAGVAVYGVITNIIIIGMSLFNGVAQAAQPQISAAHGAGDGERIRAVIKMGVVCEVIVSGVLLAFGESFPQLLVAMFVSDPSAQVLSIAPAAIRLYFIALPVMSLNIFFVVYLQSVVRPVPALVLSLLRGLALASALVLILPLFMGGYGVWLAVPIAEIITVGLTLCFCARKNSAQNTLKTLDKV